MATFHQFVNNAVGTVQNNPLSNSGTNLVVDSTLDAKLSGLGFPYYLTIWDPNSNVNTNANMEIVEVTARPSPNNYTIVRGRQGTSGVSHQLGSSVSLLFTRGNFQESLPQGNVEHGSVYYIGSDLLPHLLEPGSDGQFLKTKGPGSDPEWVTISAASNPLASDYSDGDINFDGSNTYASFSSKVGSTYTLTRDVYGDTVSVQTGVTVVTAGYRVFGRILNNAGTIHNKGGDGGNGTNPGSPFEGQGGSAGSASLSGTMPGGVAGKVGGNGGNTSSGGSNGSNGDSSSYNLNSNPGSNGGNGGSAGFGGGSGGTGGANNNPVNPPRNAINAYYLFFLTSATAIQRYNVNSGSGGGGGGGGRSFSGGYGAGGGGSGGSGGCVFLAFEIINNTGTISAEGGKGGNGGDGNPDFGLGNTGGGGGGGGGNGGIVFLYYITLNNSGTITAAGGTGGSPGSQGSPQAGQNGSNGLVVNITV